MDTDAPLPLPSAEAEEPFSPAPKDENRLPINWFPGHMRRTGKLIEENLSRVDVVIEMRDARIPFSGANPFLRRLIRQKPALILLNKADLADERLTAYWVRALSREGQAVVPISSKAASARRKTAESCRRLAADGKQAGKKRIRAMITGIPNAGKSTLLNLLAGKTKAKAENRPGVTTDLQKIQTDLGIDLLDTPGLLWPKIETEWQGIKLVAVGAVKDSVVDIVRVSLKLAQLLLSRYPQALQQRFKVERLPETPLEWLKTVAEKRGCLRPGGIPDVERAARLFLTEFREGRMGPLSLDFPDDFDELTLKRPVETGAPSPGPFAPSAAPAADLEPKRTEANECPQGREPN